MENEQSTITQPERSSHVRAYLATSAAVFFILIVCGAIWISNTLFVPLNFSSPHTVTIEQGSSVARTSTLLFDAGLIRNAQLFRMLVNMRYRGATIKAGEYRIAEPLNLIGAAELFVKGAPKKELTIRIIEGWTIADIASYLDRLGIVSKSDFLSETLKDYSKFSFLSPHVNGMSLEGYLFPDTYRIYEKSTAADIVEKCLLNFARHYSYEEEGRTLNADEAHYSIHSTVTMASILEHEVKDSKDREMVADIFYRRIRAGMPLQADSTINYITGKSDPSARAADLSVDSPYNTYVHKGLPPGPIGNPGIDALHAALHPLANPYLFFLTTPEGRVVYSKTFEEHVKNKMRYLSKKK